MQDNFNIHGWQLKTAINELDETEKIKGKDGKGCWKGYRYAGTENGKDKCVPVNEEEIGLSDILARELYKLQGKISDDLFYKLRKAINSQDPAALAKAKEIMSRIKPEDDRIYMGEEKAQCPECGCQMESTMCNECGYAMNENASSFYSRDYVEQKYGAEKAKEIEQNIEYEEDNNPNIWDLYVNMQSPEEVDDFVQGFIDESTFTGKYNNDPKLKGGQKDLPDEVQAKIVAKEGEVDEARADLRLPEGYYIAKDRFELAPGGRPWRSQFNKGQVIVVRKDETMGVWNNEKKAWVPKTTPESPRVYYKINDLQGGNIMLQTFLNNTKKISKEEAENIINNKMNEAMFTSANSNNPEGDALVLRFLQGIAKKFDYPVAQAALFVKERIKKLGY
jgi:hypothetical protein